LFPYAGWIPGQILVVTGGPRWSGKKQRKKKEKRGRAGLLLLGWRRLLLAAWAERGAVRLAGWDEIGPVRSGGRNSFLFPKFCFLFSYFSFRPPK
jgi:hypothetical protein